MQAANGDFYGTAVGGGTANDGVIFKVTPTGTLTVLYNFCSVDDCADGSEPNAGMILGTDGNFYGTTISGGAHNDGTIFQMSAAGKVTVLYSFCSLSGCADGESPYSGLIQSTDGNFLWYYFRWWRRTEWWHRVQAVDGAEAFCGSSAGLREGWGAGQHSG